MMGYRAFLQQFLDTAHLHEDCAQYSIMAFRNHVRILIPLHCPGETEV